jgi:uncharacterized protein (DUF4415 family)
VDSNACSADHFHCAPTEGYFRQRAEVNMPRGTASAKGSVSVRHEPQVLDWLRSKGEERLTRINDILTNLMEAERRVGSGR